MELLSSLQAKGQNLWMHDIARNVFFDGSLMQHISDWAISGVLLTPEAVCQYLNESDVYDRAIRKRINQGLYGEPLAVDLLIEDTQYAADILRHVFNKTDGVNGWVALPISPLLTSDSKLKNLILSLYAKVGRPNVLIIFPGCTERLNMIEELTHEGIPICISHIYSPKQYTQAINAYMNGVNRRIDAGLNPAVQFFTSIPIFEITTFFSKTNTFISAIDKTAYIANLIHKNMMKLNTSHKWQIACSCGARNPQLIWIESTNEHMKSYNEYLFNKLTSPFTVTAIQARPIDKNKNSISNNQIKEDGSQESRNESKLPKETDHFIDNAANGLQDNATMEEVKKWFKLLEAIAKKSAEICRVKSEK